MNRILTKMIGDREAWKRMEARADALPRDDRVAYGEMKSYMWRFTAGEDVVAYCDAHLGGANPYDRHLHRWRRSLNPGVKSQF